MLSWRDAVHLSESACLRRVRALEDEGLINSFVALLDQKKVGLTDTVFRAYCIKT